MNDQPQAERNYEERLSLHLLKLLGDGAQPLGSLLSRAQGAYPTDVLASLKELERAGKAKELAKNTWALAGAGTRRLSNQPARTESQSDDDSEFPEAHPLDFDWRFGRRALARLGQKIDDLPSKRIAVLGAPTLFKYLREHKKCAHLFDRNEQIVSFLRDAGYPDITQCDLFNYSGQEQFDCVIADPPWYLAHYRAFIHAARLMLVAGKTLFLSMLPPLTRPSAQNDRLTIVKFASDRGFDLVSEDPAFLEYVSPPFELEALRSDGLHALDWRLGDLFTFVVSERTVSPYKPEEREDEQFWRTFALGRSIVKVKWDGTRLPSDFSFDTVSETSDIRFRSVSRRSPLRSKINLWTSRNVALRVTRPDVVCAALQLLSEGHSPEHVSNVIAQVEHLGAIEIDRLMALLDILRKESARR